MIVVMLVLLAGTATAMFGVHSTTFEIRASGHARQSLQTQYVAETALVAAMTRVDEMGGAQALLFAMRQSVDDPTFDPNLTEFGEPDLLPGKHNHRFVTENFNLDVIDNEALGGMRQPYQPQFVVDINDDYVYDTVVPGHRAGGRGMLQYFYATYTARGRLILPGQLAAGGVDNRPYHEGAHDARAHALSGPIGR
jgi:hypothetical protein